jgi:hypothetical protein
MLRVVSNISLYVKGSDKTMNAFDPELAIQLLQSIVVVVSGVFALYFNRRFAKEMAGKLKAVYGKLFNVDIAGRLTFHIRDERTCSRVLRPAFLRISRL